MPACGVNAQHPKQESTAVTRKDVLQLAFQKTKNGFQV